MPQIAPIGPFELSGFGDPILRELNLDPVGSKDGLTTYTGGETKTVVATSEVTEAPTVPALQTQYTVSLNRPSKTSRISKVRIKLVMPVEAKDTAGNPTGVKSHDNSVDITYLFSEKSSLAERQNLVTAFMNLIQTSDNEAIITELKSLY
jgi:hypothetical protein